MLVDLSKCTACRGCQVACKNWNGLPAEINPENRGSYQNPADLTPTTYTLIRFQEVDDKENTIKWLFRNDKCFHCTDAGCMNRRYRFRQQKVCRMQILLSRMSILYSAI